MSDTLIPQKERKLHVTECQTSHRKGEFFFVTIKIFPAIVTTNQRNLSLLTTQLRIAQNLLRRQLDGDLVLCCILMDLSFSLVRKLKKKKRKNTRLSSSRVDWMIGY